MASMGASTAKLYQTQTKSRPPLPINEDAGEHLTRMLSTSRVIAARAWGHSPITACSPFAQTAHSWPEPLLTCHALSQPSGKETKDP
jgi:hypothetical protein